MRVHYQKGLTLFLNRQYKLAETEFRQELAENPEYSSAHAMLAMSMLQQAKIEPALHAAKEATRLAPDLAYGHYALASANYRKGRMDVALSEIQQALRLDPNDSFYYARAAEIKMVGHQYKQALEFADAGLQIDPKSINCLVDRANILVKIDRLDEAELAVDRALDVDPEEPSAHLGKGLILLHKGAVAESLKHYREALRLAPHSTEARKGVAMTLKARYPFYNQVLSAALWLGRMDKRILLVAIVVLCLSPATYLPGLLVFLLAAGNFAFNFLLQFDPVGRTILTDKERIETNSLVGLGLVLTAFVLFGIWRESHDRLFSEGENNARPQDKEQVLFAHYLPDVQKRIKSNWHPPSQKKSSRVTVLFDAQKDGQLKHLKITQSSGDQDLDESALKAVEAIVPLPKFPAGAKDDAIAVEFTFDYNVRKEGRQSKPQEPAPDAKTKP